MAPPALFWDTSWAAEPLSHYIFGGCRRIPARDWSISDTRDANGQGASPGSARARPSGKSVRAEALFRLRNLFGGGPAELDALFDAYLSTSSFVTRTGGARLRFRIRRVGGFQHTHTFES